LLKRDAALDEKSTGAAAPQRCRQPTNLRSVFVSRGQRGRGGPRHRAIDAPYTSGFTAALFAIPVDDAELCHRGHFVFADFDYCYSDDK
jgi:hypothetical protein